MLGAEGQRAGAVSLWSDGQAVILQVRINENGREIKLRVRAKDMFSIVCDCENKAKSMWIDRRSKSLVSNCFSPHKYGVHSSMWWKHYASDGGSSDICRYCLS